MRTSFRTYHEATKHTPVRLRRYARSLDWANMPNPYRHYDGVPVLDLPADPPAPAAAAWDVLRGRLAPAAGLDGAALLSQLLFHSAAVSAVKRAGASTYALRVNPSSGNLHPTEFHFVARGLAGWPDGLYHYRPSQHTVEQRATGTFGFDAPLTFVLTSIAWREAWKYRFRAYRYCLLDIGHAAQALQFASLASGLPGEFQGDFDDAALARELGLAGDEWPLAVVSLGGPGAPAPVAHTVPAGVPNALSERPRVPGIIERIHAVTGHTGAPYRWEFAGSEAAPLGGPPFGELARARRSALDFEGGARSIPLHALLTLLALADLPHLTLYAYVHRVDGLAPGVYVLEGGELRLVRAGDQRVAAAGLSLGQDLAGNAVVAFSMIADIERAEARYGERAYRYVHFEAGALGQRLYLAAEALGLRGTGIGAFFDDRVHEYLGNPRGQVVYHFAVGYPVHDPRLDA